MPARPCIWYKACKIDCNIKRDSVIVWMFAKSFSLDHDPFQVLLYLSQPWIASVEQEPIPEERHVAHRHTEEIEV